MKKLIFALSISLAVGLGVSVYAHSFQAPKAVVADATTKKVVAAGEALLATLSPEQRKLMSFEFTDTAQRVRWSNLPSGMVQRKGLRMGDLSEVQLKAVHALLQSVLSKSG